MTCSTCHDSGKVKAREFPTVYVDCACKRSAYKRCCPGCGLKLDPYRISDIYQHDGRQHHLSKKALCAGERGHKDLVTDLKDVIATAQRWLEMLTEDEKRAAIRGIDESKSES